MGNACYDDGFYKNMINDSRTAASVVVPYILSLFPHVRSVVDFGCGPGVWLKEFELAGREICGYDFGSGVPENLIIPPKCWKPLDLSTPFKADRKYDLAISLEVAEHIPAARADEFVTSLANTADIILFSAALPGQGGTCHHNEQCPMYWVSRFEDNGFRCADFLRPHFWHDARIVFWYRQNMILCLRKDIVDAYDELFKKPSFSFFPIVHPEMFSVFLQRKEYAEGELKKCLERLNYMEHSRSWRITKPLRLAAGLVRKLSGLLSPDSR